MGEGGRIVGAARGIISCILRAQPQTAVTALVSRFTLRTHDNETRTLTHCYQASSIKWQLSGYSEQDSSSSFSVLSPFCVLSRTTAGTYDTYHPTAGYEPDTAVGRKKRQHSEVVVSTFGASSSLPLRHLLRCYCSIDHYCARLFTREEPRVSGRATCTCDCDDTFYSPVTRNRERTYHTFAKSLLTASSPTGATRVLCALKFAHLSHLIFHSTAYLLCRGCRS